MSSLPREKVLAGILGAVVLLVVWIYLPSSGDSGPALKVRPQAADPEGGSSRSGGTGPKIPLNRAVELKSGDLDASPGGPYTPGRDPWRFVEPPPPPPVKPIGPSPAELARLQAERDRLAREQAEAARRAAAEAAIPKPPPFTMTYLGSFGPPNRRIAVFTDGKSIYDVQQGETIEGKFVVAQIGYESVDIKFVGFPEWKPQRLPVGRSQ